MITHAGAAVFLRRHLMRRPWWIPRVALLGLPQVMRLECCNEQTLALPPSSAVLQSSYRFAAPFARTAVLMLKTRSRQICIGFHSAIAFHPTVSSRPRKFAGTANRRGRLHPRKSETVRHELWCSVLLCLLMTSVSLLVACNHGGEPSDAVSKRPHALTAEATTPPPSQNLTPTTTRPHATARRIMTGEPWPEEQVRSWRLNILPTLGAPDAECHPVSELGDVEALGPSIEGDCFYDVNPTQLFEAESCPYANTLGCPESYGPYYGRLVRLSGVELSLTGESNKYLPIGGVKPARYHSGCGGKWRTGVRVGQHLLELLSVADDNGMSFCRPRCKDRKSHPRPQQYDRVPELDEVYPDCPLWVWDELTLIVRPKSEGLEIVVPPKGTSAKDWL